MALSAVLRAALSWYSCRVGLAFELVEVAAGLQRAFLDQHDVQARGREQFGRDAGAGAAADDRDVAADRLRRGGVCATVHAPAAREAFTDRIGLSTHR